MKWMLYIAVMLFSFTTYAQDDVFDASKVRGLVRRMHVKKDMVWMSGDNVVYGERRDDHIYTFNDDGLIISDTQTYDHNKEQVFQTYIYQQNKLTEVDVMGKNGAVVRRDRYKYLDDKIAEMSRNWKDSNKYLSDTNYEYFNDSFHVVYQHNIGKGYRSMHTCIYDEHGNIGKVLFYDSSALAQKVFYEYDMFNNPVLQKVSTPDGRVLDYYTYEYIYDEHHNFIERKEYKNKHLYSVTIRQIMYQ